MNKLIIFFCACFFGSCSSARPQEVGVDQEAIAIDIDQCVAYLEGSKGAACTVSNAVGSPGTPPKSFPVDYVTPGTHAIFLQPGEAISAPIQIPPNAKALVYLVVAMGAPGGELNVAFDDATLPPTQQSQQVRPVPGPNRTEIGFQPPAALKSGAHVTLRNDAKDPFAIVWVLGRWAD